MQVHSSIWLSVFSGIILLASSSLATAQNADDDVRLVAFDQEHPLIDLQSSGPLVEVFSSGRVVVNRPPVMKNSGIFEIFVTDEELARIASLVSQATVVSTNDEAVQFASDIMSLDLYISDSTTSMFGFGNDQVRATNNSMDIEIENVTDLAESVPNLPGLSELNELQQILLGLASGVGQ